MLKPDHAPWSNRHYRHHGNNWGSSASAVTDPGPLNVKPSHSPPARLTFTSSKACPYQRTFITVSPPVEATSNSSQPLLKHPGPLNVKPSHCPSQTALPTIRRSLSFVHMTPANRTTGLLESNAVAGPSNAAAASDQSQAQVLVGEKRKREEGSEELWTRPYPRDGSVEGVDALGQTLLRAARSRRTAMRLSSESFDRLLTTARELDSQAPAKDADLVLARSMASDLQFFAERGIRADPSQLRYFAMSSAEETPDWTLYIRSRRYSSAHALAKAAKAVMKAYPGDAISCTLLIEQCEELQANGDDAPVWVFYAGQTERDTPLGRCKDDLSKSLPTLFSRWNRATVEIASDAWQVWSLKDVIRQEATQQPVRENIAKQLAEYALVASVAGAGLNSSIGGLHHLPRLAVRPLSAVVPSQLRDDSNDEAVDVQLCPVTRQSFRSMVEMMSSLPSDTRSDLMGSVAQAVTCEELATLVRLPGGRCLSMTVNHSATDEGYRATERGLTWYGVRAGPSPKLNLRLRLSSLGLDPEDQRYWQEDTRPLVAGPVYDVNSIAREAPFWLSLAFLSRHLMSIKPQLISIRSAQTANIFLSDVLGNLWRTDLSPFQQTVLNRFQKGQAVNPVDLETCLSNRGRQAKDKALEDYSTHVGKLVVVKYGPGNEDWSIASLSFDAGVFKYDARLTTAAIRLQSLISDRDVAVEETLLDAPARTGQDRKNWCLFWSDTVRRDLQSMQLAVLDAKEQLSVIQEWYGHRTAGSTRQRDLDSGKAKRIFTQADRSSLLVIGAPNSDERSAAWEAMLEDHREREERGLKSALSKLLPRGWALSKLGEWWMTAIEGVDAIYALNASVNHPTAANDDAANKAYAFARFGKMQTGTRASKPLQASTVPSGGPAGFSGPLELLSLLVELCDENKWLARAHPVEAQASDTSCRHCDGRAITTWKTEHGCFGIRQEARRCAGLAGMPASADLIDCGFVSTSEALGLQKKKLVWAFEITNHPVFGLDGSHSKITLDDLAAQDIKMIDPRHYLPPAYTSRSLPLVPLSTASSQAFRVANCIAVLLSCNTPTVNAPTADVSDDPFWEIAGDRRMAKVANGEATVRPTVCKREPPCAHWSLQTKSGRHTCALTVEPIAANVAIAESMTEDAEPAAKSRQERAARVGGAAPAKSKVASKSSGTEKITCFKEIPAAGQLRLWTAYLRPADPLHQCVSSTTFKSIGAPISDLRLGESTSM